MDRSRLKKWKVIVTAVGGLFFPQRTTLGLDSRALTPGLVERITYATAESRSHKRAALVLKKVGGNSVSASTVERVAQDVGQELVQLRDEAPSRLPRNLVPSAPADPPTLAVVECDGGRIRTREPGHGPGVHKHAWRETKNACLVKMTHQTFEVDPQPNLPDCFRDHRHVADLAEMGLPEGYSPTEPSDGKLSQDELGTREDWRPKRLVRTCLSSMVEAKEFGKQMNREARRRRFHEAPHRAFLGDGLPWNWTIWKRCFKNFVPILDFIHALTYLYQAAVSQYTDLRLSWNCYLEWAQTCWSGRVYEVLEQLGTKLDEHDIKREGKLDERHPHKPLLDAYRYLTTNQSRMDYARYRQLGLPVTTALMESLVKEINQRAKGTEMFWNDPDGGEYILQIRSAALCDDDRLSLYLENRPGHAYVRRSTSRRAA